MRSANHLVVRILGDRDVSQLIYSDPLPDPTWTSTPPEPLFSERGTRIDASGEGGTLSLARRIFWVKGDNDGSETKQP